MSWNSVNLHGAKAIQKVCGEYEISDPRLPGGKFRVKVFQKGRAFNAFASVSVRDASGEPDGMAGLGATELEALSDVVARLNELLATRAQWSDEQLAWMDEVLF